MREKAAKKVGEMGNRAIPAIPFLIQLLNDNGETEFNREIGLFEEVSNAALSSLIKFGKPSVQPCIDALKWSEEERLGALIFVLGQIKDPAAIGPLTTLTTDIDPHVRVCAVDAFRGWTDSKGVAPLICALQDTDQDVRESAATVLGGMHDARIVPALANALKDKAATVREAAAMALGVQREKDAVPALLNVVRSSSEDSMVRFWAAKSIGRIAGSKSLDDLVAVLNDRAVPELVRRGAAEALGIAKDRRFVEPLGAVATNDREPPDLRGTVIDAIASLDGTRAIQFLTKVAVTPAVDGHVRCCAAMQIVHLTGGAIEDVRIVHALEGRYAIERHMTAVVDAAGAKERAVRLITQNGKSGEVLTAAFALLKKWARKGG